MTPAERDLFSRRAKEARRLGRNLWDHLDSRENLLTHRRYRRVRSETMYDLANDLENMSIKEILKRYGSNSSTALDAQRGIVALIRDLAWKEAST